jgi:hypothetical protein
MPRASVAILERQVRRLGSMEPDEHFLEAFQAKMLRCFEHGDAI